MNLVTSQLIDRLVTGPATVVQEYCTAKCNTNDIKLDFLFYEVMSMSRFNDRRFIAGTILDRTLLRLRLNNRSVRS